jgi:hypothetical protein
VRQHTKNVILCGAAALGRFYGSEHTRQQQNPNSKELLGIRCSLCENRAVNKTRAEQTIRTGGKLSAIFLASEGFEKL